MATLILMPKISANFILLNFKQYWESEWRLFVPANLAYGERGSNNKIGPNEALIFDINLVEVLEKKK